MNTDTPKDKNPLPAQANGHETLASKPPVPLPLDVASLSDDALATVFAAATSELERRTTTLLERAAVLGVSARLTAARAGKPAVRIRADGETDRRHAVKPVFRNPKSHGQTWSKRGEKPQWYVDHLAAGGSEADMLIPENEK